MSTNTISRFLGCTAAALIAAAMLTGCAKKEPPAQTAPAAADHASFASAQEAVDAMIAALEAGDEAALLRLFGPGTEQLVSSGDNVADANDRAGFVEAYRAKHELVAEGDGRMILQVGENDWPAPVPVVQRDGRWYLDGAAGEDEIIFRRVGRNELAAIEVCRGFVDAQNEYASEGRDDNPPAGSRTVATSPLTRRVNRSRRPWSTPSATGRSRASPSRSTSPARPPPTRSVRRPIGTTSTTTVSSCGARPPRAPGGHPSARFAPSTGMTTTAKAMPGSTRGSCLRTCRG